MQALTAAAGSTSRDYYSACFAREIMTVPACPEDNLTIVKPQEKAIRSPDPWGPGDGAARWAKN